MLVILTHSWPCICTMIRMYSQLFFHAASFSFLFVFFHEELHVFIEKLFFMENHYFALNNHKFSIKCFFMKSLIFLLKTHMFNEQIHFSIEHHDSCFKNYDFSMGNHAVSWKIIIPPWKIEIFLEKKKRIDMEIYRFVRKKRSPEQ